MLLVELVLGLTSHSQDYMKIRLVEVKFFGPHRFYVYGSLYAQGTVEDSVYFKAADPDAVDNQKWKGIYFSGGTTDTISLSYSHLSGNGQGQLFTMWGYEDNDVVEFLHSDFIHCANYYNEAVRIEGVYSSCNNPIVIDHYGDILWKLNRKIQARYFWLMVLDMDDAEQKLKDNIENKLIDGPKNS